MRYRWLATRVESSVGVVDIDIDMGRDMGSDIALGDLQACENWIVWSMLWRRLRYTGHCAEDGNVLIGDGYAFGMLFFFSSGREVA